MQLHCKACGREIPAANVNLERAIAKCDGCDAVFGFADQIGQRPPAERGEVMAPGSMTVEHDPGGLTITRRWFSPAFFFLAFFCVFWDGFLVVWYAMAFAGPGPEVDAAGPPLMVFLFPLIHVAVGVGLTYYVIAGFLNRTIVRVGRGELSVSHGPVPWPGNKTLLAHSISQLYCRRKVRNSKNGRSYTYRVELQRGDGSRDVLLKGLADEDEALYVEQQLEQHLGIEDRPVRGELARA